MPANFETYGGVSSYLYKQNRTRDHCVIGQGSFHKSIRVGLLISIVIATTFVFIKVPIPILEHCQRVHEMSQDSEPNSKSTSFYYMVAIVIESIILWASFVCYLIHGFIKHMPEAITEMDVKIHYCVFVFLIITYPIAILCYVIWKSHKVGLKNRLVKSGCKSATISLLYYCSGCTAITCTAQFLVFHTFYIIIAAMTIVSVFKILLFVSLCVGIIGSILVGITYTLESLDKRSWTCSLQNCIMYILLNIAILFNFAILMYINETGNFPVIMKSFSILSIAGLVSSTKAVVKQFTKCSRKTSTDLMAQ